MVYRYVFAVLLLRVIKVFIESGFVAYNSKYHVCCSDDNGGGVLAPLPANVSGNPAACCFSDDHLTAYIYDPNTYECCGGRPQFKSDPDKLYVCCQNGLHDFDDFICCSGQLIGRASSRDCCGRTTYDRDTHICCRDDLPDDAEGGRNRIHRRLHGRQECCGSDSLYDTGSQLCCELGNGSRAAYPRTEETGDAWMTNGCCAGRSLDDVEKQVCHDGQIRKRPSAAFRFCSGRLYDTVRQRCCDGIEFDNDSGFDCCPGASSGNPRLTSGYAGSPVYDTKTQLCCGSSIIELSAKDMEKSRSSCCKVFDNVTGKS